jgi:hypothetical protein
MLRLPAGRIAVSEMLSDLPATEHFGYNPFRYVTSLGKQGGLSSMAFRESFSRRNRYSGAPKEITIRENAPESLRVAVLETVTGKFGWKPSALRETVCAVLRVRPNPDNWSERPNIWDEVQGLVYDCEWFKVYDIIEAIYARFSEEHQLYENENAQRFAEDMNAVFEEDGIGWQLVDGQVVMRGSEAFEVAVREAPAALNDTGRPTAAGHLHEALQDLSRRPEADLPGAIYHAMGAMECVARDVSGEPKATLGEILKKHQGLLPPPLDPALSQIWGYASNEARHVREGRNPSREEAELIVGLAAALATYLTRKGAT